MAAALVVVASFFIALAFALKRRQWFMGWLLGSLVPAAVFPVIEFFSPTGWLGVALVFGTLYCTAASTAGLLIAWLIARGKQRGGQTAWPSNGGLSESDVYLGTHHHGGHDGHVD